MDFNSGERGGGLGQKKYFKVLNHLDTDWFVTNVQCNIFTAWFGGLLLGFFQTIDLNLMICLYCTECYTILLQEKCIVGQTFLRTVNAENFGALEKNNDILICVNCKSISKQKMTEQNETNRK